MVILAGIAYVSLQDVESQTVKSLLLGAGGYLLLVAGTTFSIAILLHQKSKIERWKKPFGFLIPLSWVETWLVASMMGVATTVVKVLVPGLS